MVDLSDRRRSGRRLLGSFRTLNRSSRRRVISSTVRVLVRAAASSMASGRPSRDRHRSSTRSSSRAVPVSLEARRPNSSTASGRSRGASSTTRSPSISSGSWLVHRMRRAGAWSSSRTARSAATSTTCSQLSRTTRAEPTRSRSKRAASLPGPCSAAMSTSTTSARVTVFSSRASQTASTASDASSRRPTSRATAVLPIPPGPITSTSRSRDNSSASVSTSASRPTSSGRHRREVAPRSAGPVGRCRHRTRRDLLRKDVPLQPLESRPGVEAELVSQLGPDPLVGGQRVGLPPGPVERRDEQLPQALMERVLRDRALELADHAARPTELEPRPEPDLEQGGVRLVDAGARNARPLGVAGHQERRSPEQPQRRAAQVRRLLRLATLPKARCRRGGPLHREHIHVVRLDLERVATVAAGDGRRSEGAPEHRDLGLQRVAPDLGGRRRPQVLDQTLGAHELTGLEGEPRQQLRRLAARHLDLRAVDPDLQGSQQRNVQHPTRLGRVLGRPDVSLR